MTGQNTPRPRVLVVSRMSPRRNSRTRRLIRSLTPRFDVEALAESVDGLTPVSTTVNGALVNEVALPQFKHNPWHAVGGLRVLAFNAKGLAKLIRNKPHVVVCSDSLYAITGIAARLLFRRGFVYDSHEVMWALGNPPLMAAFLGFLERIAIQASDFWMVPSEKRASLILEKHRIQKPYLVYENYPLSPGDASQRNAYRTRLYQAGVPADQRIVMFQGSVELRRGVEEMIQAAGSGRFHLVVQGQGPLLATLQSKSPPHVTFLEPCSNEETVAWLSAADFAFVYYENDCLNSAYACSNKFYTAIFAGTPMVCNRLPVFELHAQQYGGVVFIDQFTPQAINTTFSGITDPLYTKLRSEISATRQAFLSVSLEQRIAEAFKRWEAAAG